MEKPYKGRATIQDNFTDLQITIPAKRNWFAIIFLGFWLCGWLVGEVSALNVVAKMFRGISGNFFILIWLTFWTVGGFFAFKNFLWNLTGKEMITVGQGTLTIDKKGALLTKPKVYNLDEIKNIRVQEDNLGSNSFFSGKRNDFGKLVSSGTIRFDYGLQTVKFAGDIDEAEAKFILDKLKDRHLLTQKNYN